jgi:Ca-activated chloride channel family protein
LYHPSPRDRRTSLILILCGLSAIARPAAQFVSGVSLVEVYVSVTDPHGEPVSGLSRTDFTVEEDGQPQRVDTFAAGEFPLSVAIAIDRSFSVTAARLNATTAAAARFVSELRPDDQVMVMAIGSTVEVLAPLSTDRGASRAALSTIERWGTTPLYDAAAAAIDGVEPARGRRALIVLSDGSDRYSALSGADLVQKARRSDVLIYPIALGKERPPIFAELAAVTGGRSFQASDERSLSSTLGAIARELRAQYLLGYAPAREAATAPRWRSIQVRVSRPDVRVRARDGYLSR